MLDALIRGLLPATHNNWPGSILTADRDGHTRGLGRDFGDGPILWHLVACRHAIEERDRSAPPR
jgi:hypothetical protein